MSTPLEMPLRRDSTSWRFGYGARSLRQTGSAKGERKGRMTLSGGARRAAWAAWSCEDLRMGMPVGEAIAADGKPVGLLAARAVSRVCDSLNGPGPLCIRCAGKTKTGV